MKKKIKYSDVPPGGEPVGEHKRIKDFLPPPEELVLKGNYSSITIPLSRSSLDFFKQQAKKYNTTYQQLIRNILDDYVKRNNNKNM